MRLKTFEKFTQYKELEFVCHNSDSKDSSDLDALKKLYTELQKIDNIFPYMQDFSENGNTQISLAVIILDGLNEHKLESIILSIAKKFNIKFDLYRFLTNKQVDSIIRGEYYDNMIK